MTPAQYRRVREGIGSQEQVARLLEVSSATIAHREQGTTRIRLEAAYALERLAQMGRKRPSPAVRRLKDTTRSEVDARQRKRNRARRDAEFIRCYGSEERVLFVQSLACVVPGCQRRPSDNCHWLNGGMGRKGPADSIFPACRQHHREEHSIGTVSFEQKYGLDLAEEARITEAKWRAVS